jgi:exopolyphosphatase/guanosine-5'-triphosphate,3'-diphosphate pyrophosphatase
VTSPEPIAVVDVGSNSGRVVVLLVDGLGHLEVLADGRATLRLARDVDKGGAFPVTTMQRTAEAVRDFAAIAHGSGARRVVAVATAAVRDAGNGAEMLERIHEASGVRVRLISGEEEARFGLIGAIHGLPVEDGMTLDVGGGSLELSTFRHRSPGQATSLPLGALLLSDRFLATDPPTGEEMARLRSAVRTSLAGAGVGALEPGERLVGTGGTLRNLAKIDRRLHEYPVKLLHGYVLTRPRVEALAALLEARKAGRRRRIPGLNPDRADSIVGGAAIVQEVMATVGAETLLVSGQGLREGIALETLQPRLPSVEEVRRASVRALAERFSTWDPRRAEQRAAVAATLFDALGQGLSPKDRDRVEQAATLLDVGRAIDYYRRFDHTADVVLESDLAGFSHRKLALLSAVIRRAGDPTMSVRIYAPLLATVDRGTVDRTATMLAIADEVEHRLTPRGAEAVRCEVQGRRAFLHAPLFDPYRTGILAARFRKSFGKELVVRPDGAADA